MNDLSPVDLPTSQQRLMVKRTRFERVLELWHGEQISTFCIAERLGLDEGEVCSLINEGGSQCWRDRAVVP
jgi:hypothetical protein